MEELQVPAPYLERASALGIDPLLAQLCLKHPGDIPAELAERIQKKSAIIRERREAVSNFIAEQIALADELARKKKIIEAKAELEREVIRLETEERGFSGHITMKVIRSAVCEHFNIGMNELISDRRARKLTTARQICYLLARRITALSYPQISRMVGGRDHSTVIYGIRNIESRIAKEPHLKVSFEFLLATLSQKEAA